MRRGDRSNRRGVEHCLEIGSEAASASRLNDRDIDARGLGSSQGWRIDLKAHTPQRSRNLHFQES